MEETHLCRLALLRLTLRVVLLLLHVGVRVHVHHGGASQLGHACS